MAAHGVCQGSVFSSWNVLWIIILIWGSGCAVMCSASSVRVVTGGNVTVGVGHNAVFRCEVREGHASMVQWSRCSQQGALLTNTTLLVYLVSKAQVAINSPAHTGRVTMTTANSFTLSGVTREDYGAYCCKVTGFPYGSAEGRVYLMEAQGGHGHTHPNLTSRNLTPPNLTSPKHTPLPPAEGTLFGLPLQMVYILAGVGGAILLLVTVTTIIICKRCGGRSRDEPQDYVNVAKHDRSPAAGQGGRAKTELKEEEEEEEDEDYEDEEEMDYLNVPAYQDP